MVAGAFTWDALGWYNIRSFGHSTLEATGISSADITLVAVDDISALSRGDEVTGFVDDDDHKKVLYYVSDVSDDWIALQDTTTSFGYVRAKKAVTLIPGDK